MSTSSNVNDTPTSSKVDPPTSTNVDPPISSNVEDASSTSNIEDTPSTSKSRGRKRGLGVCNGCNEEYTNRKKPKFCKCGYELGGSFVPKVKKPPCLPSVEIWSFEGKSFLSVKKTPNDDRGFALVEHDKSKICYVKKCMDARSLSSISELQFTCKHLEAPISQPEYRVSFSADEINKFTVDRTMASEMLLLQDAVKKGETVVKVSPKSYAVKVGATPNAEMGFAHVSVTKIKNKNGEDLLQCRNDECCRKLGCTKQVGANLYSSYHVLP